MLSLVRRVDEAWYEARLEGQSGLVPGNYLDVIEPPVTRDTKDDRLESVSATWGIPIPSHSGRCSSEAGVKVP